MVADVLLINGLFVLFMALNPVTDPESNRRTAWMVCNVAIAVMIIWQWHQRHGRRIIIMDHVVLNAIKAVFIHALFFLAILEFINISLGVSFYAEFYGTMVVVLPVWWTISRYIIKSMRRRGRNFTRVVIVGTNRTARRLYHEMKVDKGFGFNVMGFFDDEPREDFDGEYLGTLDMLDQYVKKYAVNEIYFAMSGEKDEVLARAAKVADDNMCQFYYVPRISHYVNAGYELHTLGSMPVLTLRHNPLRNPVNRVVKRTFDIVFSTAFLVISPVIFVPVAIAIKLSSPGPVFFRQRRTGYMGRSFVCLKFRTMRVNAAADKVQTTKDDPRKTKVGDFLRRTSIDELPQFINVWLGDMSVVGPRPHMIQHTEDYGKIIDRYMVRHVVKPGITGWAQVNGFRGLTDQLWKMERRVEYDVWYIEHWHFLLDLKIVVRTVMNAIRGEKNAF